MYRILISILKQELRRGVMKVIRALSVIALAGYLIFQGLYYLAEMPSPVMHAATGLLGLTAGVLMFLSLGHWLEHSHKGR